MVGLSILTDRKTQANKGFASSGVMYKLVALCFYSSSVQVTVFCSETRPNAKPENFLVNVK
jgi:hypothetical protein